jgi:hypothetical protein
MPVRMGGVYYCQSKGKNNGKQKILVGNAGNDAGIRNDGCWVCKCSKKFPERQRRRDYYWTCSTTRLVVSQVSQIWQISARNPPNLLFFSGSCSITEVIEQLYFTSSKFRL